MKENELLLLTMPKAVGEDEEMEYEYGIMKANSENVAKSEFGVDRAIIVRPTYMIGPADKSNRFIHWPIRLSKGGEALLPGNADDPVQYIDVRDTAEWMIRLIEKDRTGTYNAVGPSEEQGMLDFAQEATKAFDVDTSFIKIDDYEFLNENEIQYIVPWIMPIGNNLNSARVNNALSKNNGLTFRPLIKTIKDTYDWWYSDAVTEKQRLEYESNPRSILIREQSIIEKWKAV